MVGETAASKGAEFIRAAIEEKGSACIIVATGASQFEMLSSLVAQPDIDWSRVTAFHLDEYIGLPAEHQASFRRYLKERFVDKLTDLHEFHYIQGDSEDPDAECIRVGDLIAEVDIDVAFVGIGENGHLAFNDPPADFDTEKAYLIVNLDEKCRKQQMGEGWFKSLEEVPERAISMSIRQIMKSNHIIATVPDERKAQAVKDVLEQSVSNHCPSTILKNHNSCYLFLDNPSASLLLPDFVKRL